MTRALLIDTVGTLRRAALLTDGELTDLYVDRIDRPSLAGAVILGRVARVAAGMDSAFIDIGQARPGLLPASDVRAAPGAPPLPRPKKGMDHGIGTVLKAGQPVLVQVRADPVGGKGALLSMDVTLPGRYTIHTPLASGIHVSRRIAGGGPDAAAHRQRLTALIRGVAPQDGWVVRAAALTADPDVLVAEVEGLAGAWRAVHAQASSATAPALILPPPIAPVRALIEQTGQPVDRIQIEGGDLLLALKRWAADVAPDLPGLMTPYVGRGRLFDEGDIDGALSGLLDRYVPLAQGGSLIIERTEALTVIDVNGGDRGDPLSVNLSAVPEIARQLRLRNVGGVVVVDFITLKRPADQERLLLALSGAVADDPGNTQVYGMSRLGLVELTRQRRGPSLLDLLADGPLE